MEQEYTGGESGRVGRSELSRLVLGSRRKGMTVCRPEGKEEGRVKSRRKSSTEGRIRQRLVSRVSRNGKRTCVAVPLTTFLGDPLLKQWDLDVQGPTFPEP